MKTVFTSCLACVFDHAHNIWNDELLLPLASDGSRGVLAVSGEDGATSVRMAVLASSSRCDERLALDLVRDGRGAAKGRLPSVGSSSRSSMPLAMCLNDFVHA